MADGSTSTSTGALRLPPHLPASRLAREQEDEVLKKGAASFGGDEKLLAIYRRAKELVVRYDLFLLKQTVHANDAIHLVICNAWRIESSPEKDVALSERNLTTGEWYRVSDGALPGWPIFLLWPMTKGQPKFWRQIFFRVIARALDAAAYIEGMSVESLVRDSEGNHVSPYLDEVGYQLQAHYLGRWKEGHKSKWVHGVLHPASSIKAARALRAAFFEHVVDKELFSVALAIDYRQVDLHQYLKLSAHRAAVLRIARERRNLVPLLPRIDSRQWHREDLFARKWWVRGTRKSTVIDRCSDGLSSFHSPAAWRFLSRSPVSVVSTWVSRTSRAESAFGILAQANVTAKVPVVAVRKYLTQMHAVLTAHAPRIRRGDPSGLPDEVVVRVVRMYLQYAARLWSKSGHAAVTLWLGHNLDSETFSVRDYLIQEGLMRGVPQKNTTWPSLLELAKDWHARIEIEAMRQNEEIARATVWESALPECEIDGFTFTPLTSAWELAVEGYEQHHCVGSYTDWCQDGFSRIFAVRGSDTQRATLELRVDQCSCAVAQLFGAHNQTDVITDYPSMRGAAEKLAARYAAALVG